MKSWETICRFLSKTPSFVLNAAKKIQKITLIDNAIKKQFFLRQLVIKKVSIPSLSVQIKTRHVVQKGNRDQSWQKKDTKYLMGKNMVSPTVVVWILENQSTKGYYLTCAYSILMTDTYCYVFSFFFLGFSCVSLGGRNSAAPLGKNKKLGQRAFRICRATKMRTVRIQSRIIC